MILGWFLLLAYFLKDVHNLFVAVNDEETHQSAPNNSKEKKHFQRVKGFGELELVHHQVLPGPLLLHLCLHLPVQVVSQSSFVHELVLVH